MKIVIAHTDNFVFTSAPDPGKLVYVAHASLFDRHQDADAYIDMQFDGNFYSPVQQPLLVNETIRTISELTHEERPLGRFCGWKGFMERPLWEIAVTSSNPFWVDPLLHHIGKQYEIVADTPGLVAPRILSNVINEAYHAIGEGVSTIDEIDLAMKLGTNYPNGPFSWARMISTCNVYNLLDRLKHTHPRYLPHPLLQVKST